jgi:4-amino-4-deoxy-L-arabinose transferase-like glycosyltransferase
MVLATPPRPAPHPSTGRPAQPKPLAAIGLILLAGFLARAFYVVVQTQHSVLAARFFTGDAFAYDAIARSLVTGQGYAWQGHATAVVTPLYPLFLAACYLIVGRDFLAIGLLQSGLGALTAGVTYAMARLIFDQKVALLAGLICALLPEMVFWTSGQICTEPLYTFLLSLAVYALARLLPASRMGGENRLAEAAAAGLLLGAAALTRPVALGFAICATVYVWRRAGGRPAAVIGLGVAAVIGPWAARNAWVMGAPVVTSTEAGSVLYLYHSSQSTGEHGGWNPHVAPLSEAAGLTEVAANRVYLAAATRFAREQSGREVVLTARRFWNQWRPAYAGSSLRSQVVAAVTYVPLMAFALPTAFWLGFRTPRAGLLALFLAYHVLFHLLLAGEMRFRVPMEPVLAVYAAAAVAGMFRRLTARARGTRP